MSPSKARTWERYLIPSSGATVVAVGLLVLVGWYTHTLVLVQLHPTLAPMQRNTALGMILCGAGLVLSVGGKIRWGQACGVLAGTLGVLSLAEYLSGTNLGLDQMLGPGYVMVKTSHAGRMSPLTAICFIVTGATITLGWSGVAARSRAIMGGISSGLVGAISLASLFSHFGTTPAFGWTHVTVMALHTAIAFLVLQSGLLTHAWADERRAQAEFSAAREIRSPVWLPIFVGIVAGTGLLALWKGLLASEETEHPILRAFGLVSTIVFAFLFTLTARLLQKSQARTAEQERTNRRLEEEIVERERIEIHLQESQARMEAVVETASAAIVGADSTSSIISFNRAAERTFGWTAGEIVGKSLALLMPERFRDAHHHGMKRYLDTGDAHVVGKSVELVGLRKDGSEFPVELSLASWKAQGKTFFTGILRDITDRKQTEEALAQAAAKLEARVEQRTAELAQANSRLQQELAARRQVDAALEEARNHYRFLAETMPQIVWTATPDGGLDYYNERWFEYTGMTLEETQGWGWGPVLHPDDLKMCLDRWTAAVRTGKPFEVECRFKRASDGSYRWHLGRALPQRNAGGQVTKWLGTSTDIDDKKKAEEVLRREHDELETRVQERTAELAESSAKLRAVLDAATQVSIIATDTKGLITVFNAGAELMLGYRAEEMVGKNTPSIIHLGKEVEARGQELSQQFGRPVEGFEAFVAVAAQQAFEEREWTYVRRDGTQLSVSLAVTVLRDGRGNLSGFLGVAKDITERKRVEEALKSSLQMKSNFVSFATHQLRTPLAGIKWLLELVAMGDKSSEDPASLIQDARDAAERLIRMVNDLLEAARLEEGKIVLNPKDTDLGELTRSVLHDVDHQIRSQRLELSVRGGDQTPHLQLDPQLFRQVILNLVSNAMKYTPAGGKIAIEMSPQNGSLQWSIRDNGIGIPEAGQDRLFEKFFRADNVYKIETEGTGLGLYIVRMIVERSGGRIWCEGEEGEGAVFTFELPLPGAGG